MSTIAGHKIEMKRHYICKLLAKFNAQDIQPILETLLISILTEYRRILIRHIWQVRKTKLGNCLAFDLHHEIIDGHFIHLSRIDLKSSEHNLGFDWVRTQGCGRRF